MANKVHEIAFEIGAKIAGGFGKSFTKANEAVSKLGGNLTGLDKRAAAMDGLVKARQQVALSSRAYIQATERVAKLGKQLSATKEPSKELVAQFKLEKTTLARLKTELDASRNSLREMERTTGLQSTSTKDLIKQQEHLVRVQKQLKATNESLARAQKLQEKGSAMAGDATVKLARNTALVGAVVGPAVKSAIAFEDAMADVKKVVDFESPEAFQKFAKDLEEMSLKIPMAADELAAIAAAAGQSGIAQKDLMAFTEQAAKMGVAFDISADQAGEMMAKWKSGMGLTMDETVALADTTNALANTNAAAAGEIGEVLLRYGALAKTAGLTEKQLAAIAATTIGAGASAETATTGIKAFMRSLSLGASMSSKQREAFEGVGLDPEQLQKDLQKDAPAAIMNVLKTIQSVVPKERVTEILGVMFGDEAAVAIGPMMGNLELLAQNLDLVSDATKTAGSMEAEFAARSATTSNALVLAKNAATYAARAFGTPLLEPLKKLAVQFVAVAEKAGKWVSENQELVMTGLKIAGVLVGVNTAFHGLRLVIGLVLGPIAQLWKAFLLIKKGVLFLKGAPIVIKAVSLAMRGLGAAAKFMLGPWGIVITALTTAIIFSKQLKNGWEWLKQKALELWSTFAEKFPFLSGLFQTVFGPIIAQVRTIIDVFMELINFVRNVFTGQWGEAWENVKNMFGAIWSGMKDMLRLPLNGIIRMINSAMSFSVPDWVPGIGGKEFSVNIPELASGGVVKSATPAIIGEGAEPEAVIPLSKLDRMLSNAGGGGGLNVNFAPTINVAGGGDVYSQVKNGLAAGQESLKKELERLMRNQRRVAYN